MKKRSSTNLRFEFSPKIEVISAFKNLNKHQNVVERVGEEDSESGFLKVSATKNNNKKINDKSQKLNKIRMPNSEIKMYNQIMLNQSFRAKRLGKQMTISSTISSIYQSK